MPSGAFELSPFPGDPVSAGPLYDGVRLSGRARRLGSVLALDFHLVDPFAHVAWRKPDSPAERRRGLWEHTCFECFLGPADGDEYIECNLAPAGHWNVFRFDSYRAGMRDEPAFDALPVTVTARSDGLDLEVQLDAGRLGWTDVAWRLAVATVLADRQGRCSYWALVHPASQADFHDPRGFRFSL